MEGILDGDTIEDLLKEKTLTLENTTLFFLFSDPSAVPTKQSKQCEEITIAPM